MTDSELLDRVRHLRSKGRSPKDIARSLGLRPATVVPLVRLVASEREGGTSEQRSDERPLVGCWVNQGWSDELEVTGHPEWPRGEATSSGSGLATAMVAREARSGGQVSVCTILVDTFCLGVKDAHPPRKLRHEELAAWRRLVFSDRELPPLEVSLDLVQHLVFGAVEYARGLGFRPHRDFHRCLGHLGTWSGPSAITFGQDGKPMYISGPYDDPQRVLRTLDHSVGQDNYHFIVGFAPA